MIFLLMLIPAWAQAQVIEPVKETITLQDGTVHEVKITDEDDRFVYFVQDGQEKKVQKAVLKAYQRNQIWAMDWKYNDQGEVSYSEVIELPGRGKDDLYNAARLWYANTYRNSKEVLEVDDRDAGRLIGTGFSTIDPPSKRKLWATVKIEVKDGRYRYTMYDISIQEPISTYNLSPSRIDVQYLFPSGSLPGWKQTLKSMVMLSLQIKISDIKKHMETIVADDSDW